MLLCSTMTYAQRVHNPSGTSAEVDRKKMDAYVDKKVREAQANPPKLPESVQKKVEEAKKKE